MFLFFLFCLFSSGHTDFDDNSLVNALYAVVELMINSYVAAVLDFAVTLLSCDARLLLAVVSDSNAEYVVDALCFESSLT